MKQWLKDWQMVQRIALSILNAEHEHEDCSEGRLKSSGKLNVHF